MIIICDLSYKSESLSFFEYVKPIEEIIKKSEMFFKTVHYSELEKKSESSNNSEEYSGLQNFLLKKATGIILCGTALKDNEFLKKTEIFQFLRYTDIPVLGICAGLQVIAKLFGGNLIENKKIGMTTVKKISDSPVLRSMDKFEAYELHKNSFELPPDFLILAESDTDIQVIKHRYKLIFGVIFHPEVRNERVVENFLGIIRGTCKSV
ncbi:MAG: glutamine amidotransferase [Methanomicrobium sp.]|nr:glutamine amidotransferase [Methanomicrobium sp.]